MGVVSEQMRKVTTVGILVFAAVLMLPAVGESVHLGDYWELVDTKTRQFLGDHLTMAYTAKNLSSVPTYARLILGGLGCPSTVSSEGSGDSPPGPRNSAYGLTPCKFEKLYIDAVADGTPTGRSLATAIIKAVEKDGRIKLVTNRKEADAVFACHDELVEENLKGLATDASSGTSHRWIAYVVDASSCEDDKADLTYSAGQGETEQSTVETPWGMLIRYSDNTFYSLSAQKHDGSDCDIRARIYDIKLTSDQSLYLLRLPQNDMVSYLYRHADWLREATSDTAYGIAGWITQDKSSSVLRAYRLYFSSLGCQWCQEPSYYPENTMRTCGRTETDTISLSFPSETGPLFWSDPQIGWPSPAIKFIAHTH